MTERSYGGRTPAERVAERRRRLVRGVMTVLDARGEARTTMTAVCAEAGLTERYFYESFRSLDDALVAALDDVSERLLRLVLEVVEATPGPAEARVRAAFGALVRWVADDPVAARVAVVHAAANPVLRARRTVLVETYADAVAREAQELYGDDAWPPGRARLQALVLVAGLNELVAAWTTPPPEPTAGPADGLTAEVLVEVASDLFSAVMRRPPPLGDAGPRPGSQ